MFQITLLVIFLISFFNCDHLTKSKLRASQVNGKLNNGKFLF